MMKYEVSQQQYADFFNTLTPTQQTLLDPTGPNGKNTDAVLNRNGCSVTAGEMTTTLPNLPMTYVNAAMALAYLDWAGLRPMTELEFEKACRGTRAAVDDEYAWGTDKVATALYGLTDAGLPVERVTNLSTTAGNAFYRGTAVFTGMTRVGAIAGSVASPARVQSGASYYGVMDLSGNASEFAITAGSEEGREFEDARGDYQLGPQGQAGPQNWPLPTERAFSIRGGGYTGSAQLMRVADRFSGTVTLTSGTQFAGFRGAVRAGYNSVQ